MCICNKKRVCVYMCVGVVLICINATTWPLKTKIFASALLKP